MNGIHDMGGMHGFGRVEPEADEPLFHAPWEARALALNLCMRPHLTGSLRYAIERIAPADYLAQSYYERWLAALDTLRGEEGVGAETGGEVGALDAASMRRRLHSRVSLAREDARPPRFRVGDAVVARTINPKGHTRMPRYVRGKCGEVVIDHGGFALPDSAVVGGPADPQHVYAVRFSMRALWGEDAPARDSLIVDLWDSYLDPAPESA